MWLTAYIWKGDSCLALGEKLQLGEGKWSRELTLGLGTRRSSTDVLKQNSIEWKLILPVWRELRQPIYIKKCCDQLNLFFRYVNFWKVVSIPSIPLSFYIMLGFGFSNPLVPITALTLLRSFVARIASCFCCLFTWLLVSSLSGSSTRILAPHIGRSQSTKVG